MTPPANGDNGRDENTGRFLPGNSCSPGNPFTGKVMRLKTALLDAVDEQDLQDVIATLVHKARDGDVAAAKVLLDRMLGPAKEPPEEPPLDPREIFKHHLSFLSPGGLSKLVALVKNDAGTKAAVEAQRRVGEGVGSVRDEDG